MSMDVDNYAVNLELFVRYLILGGDSGDAMQVFFKDRLDCYPIALDVIDLLRNKLVEEMRPASLAASLVRDMDDKNAEFS